MTDTGSGSYGTGSIVHYTMYCADTWRCQKTCRDFFGLANQISLAHFLVQQGAVLTFTMPLNVNNAPQEEEDIEGTKEKFRPLHERLLMVYLLYHYLFIPWEFKEEASMENIEGFYEQLTEAEDREISAVGHWFFFIRRVRLWGWQLSYQPDQISFTPPLE
jgi:hypothetical protein